MKKLIFLLCFVFMASNCFAEVYIVIDKNSRQIITASEKNDTVLSDNQVLITLKGELKNIELNAPITDYKYTNKFVLNQAKIDAEEQAKEKVSQDKKKLEDKLKALGFTDDEIKVLTRGA